MTRCDHVACQDPAVWEAFASYSIGKAALVHEAVAHYPGAMIRACDQHLGGALQADMARPGSTQQWVVRPA